MDTPSLQHHYSTFTVTTDVSAPVRFIVISALQFFCLCVFTYHYRTGSCVSHKSQIYTHAFLMPFVKRSNSGLFRSLPRLVVKNEFWQNSRYRHLFKGSLSFIFVYHTWLLWQPFPFRLLPWLFTTADKGSLADMPDSFPADGPSIISYAPFTAHHHRTCRSAYGGSVQN